MKEVFVHIGPHKTGSSAIQECLSANRTILQSAGLLYLHNQVTHQAALDIARGNYERAEESLLDVKESISSSALGKALLSQEDFAGNLAGRAGGKRVYPNLTKNLRLIKRVFAPLRVTFVFFEREEHLWLKSCYHQHLKHRTDFSSFDTFCNQFDGFNWRAVLERPKSTFQENLCVVPYSSMSLSGTEDLLRLVGIGGIQLAYPPKVVNSSPTPGEIQSLERINARSAFKQTAWLSKKLVLNKWQPVPAISDGNVAQWTMSSLVSIALPELTERIAEGKRHQDAIDILPERDVDLKSLADVLLPIEVTEPDESRADIAAQDRILDYHFRGKSQLAKLNALTISYLRRDTKHTEKAKHLFQRIWLEAGVLVVNELSTRWLISTLQTFLDHGKSEAQRIIGASGFFYANLLKIYEGERAIEGLPQEASYAHLNPQTPNRFRGLDRFTVGGTDLLLNTNAKALEVAALDDAAGLVLCELLLRVRHSGNAFTRMDKTRLEKRVSVPGFENTWSFFREPK